MLSLKIHYMHHCSILTGIIRGEEDTILKEKLYLTTSSYITKGENYEM